MCNCEIDYSRNGYEKSNSGKVDKKIIMDRVKSALSVSDFPVICRVCLARTGVIPLEQTLSELFYKLTSIKLDPNSKLPCNICNDCIRQLQTIWDFIELSKINNINLQNVYKMQTEQLHPTKGISDTEGEDNSWDMLSANGDDYIEQSDEHNFEKNEFHMEVMPDLQFKTEVSNKYEENEKTNKCNLCDKECSHKHNLDIHSHSQSDADSHVCTTCGKSFKFISNLIRHNKDIHKKDKPFRCEICHKEFASFHSRKQHCCKVSNNEKPVELKDSPLNNKYCEYECNTCRESFKSLRSYKQHVKNHKNIETYECGTCHETFSKKTLLEKHIHQHIQEASSDREFTKEKLDDEDLACEHCGKQFPSKKTLYDHMPTHTKQFRCEICDKVCSKRFHLENHRKLHTGEKPFQCEFCEKTFRLKSARKAHLRVHTGERPYQCRLCKKTFAQKSNAVDHERRHTGDTPYLCRFCSKWFIQKTHLARHERTHEEGKGQNDENDKNLCKVDLYNPKETSGKDEGSEILDDDSGFARMEKKNLHIKIHSMKSTESDIIYSCKKCEKNFERKAEYRSHMIQHGESPDISDAKCRICNKVFSSKYNMQSHMVIHNETRDFLCNICGKGFSKKVYLDTHSLIHSGEKPYQCRECGKSFRQRSTYNRHVLVHTDERSFRCDQCGRAFQQKTHLQRHRAVHTGEKRFQCGCCGKRFGQNVNLQAHVRTHTGETAHHCPVCGRGFYDASSMKKHAKGHNREGGASGSGGQ